LGYKCVEISQLPMTPENVADIRGERRLGIEVSAMSASLEPFAPPPGRPLPPNMPRMENLREDYDKIVSDARRWVAPTCAWAFCPSSTLASSRASSSSRTRRMRWPTGSRDGISFYYHTHHFEFAKYDGQFALDIHPRQQPEDRL
jgi:hypothetical protein